ncbi:SdrD B-like domain-containing protein [Rhodococcus sp. OK519]|uniref:SdrD B-like domain-containing protein n=1 Tax=Rhodococcus sp. OK519 TaxID=2135729 RepID=UPI0011B1C9D4
MTNTCADDGNPVGAWVELHDAVTNVGVASVTTGPGGVFEFQNIPPGDYSVNLYPPAGCGSVPDKLPADTTSGNPVTGLNLEMVKVFSIFGFVTGCPGDTGQPTENVTVNLRDNMDAIISTTETNPNGWYFFQYKPAQAGYVVEVVPPTGCTGSPLTQTVDLSSGDANDVAFALTPQSSGSLGSIGASLENIFGSVSGSVEHVLGSSGSSGSSGN